MNNIVANRINDVYTPYHGKWSKEELFTIAKIFEHTARKADMLIVDLIDNMQGDQLFDLIELAVMQEQDLELTKAVASPQRFKEDYSYIFKKCQEVLNKLFTI